MRTWITTFVLLVVLVAHSYTPADVSLKPKIVVDRSAVTLLPDDRLAVPITIKGAKTVRACEFTLKYEGNVTRAEFEAGPYLHKAVVVTPKIDRQAQTVRIAFAAAHRAVARDAEGALGTLKIEGTVIPTSLELVGAALLDEDYQLESLVDSPRGVSDEDGNEPVFIRRTELFQSYPNPANPVATISFALRDGQHVSLRIYDVTGRLVRTLVNDRLESDMHHVTWDAMDEAGNLVASGIYFYTLTAGDYQAQKKLLILK